MAEVVRIKIEDVESRLKQLGLTLDDLHDTLRRAEADRRTCTAFDPAGLPGSIFWGRCIRYFREIHKRAGWTAYDVFNVPLTIEPAEQFAVTASSGNRDTGRITEREPTTRYAKGEATANLVANNGQLMLSHMPATPKEEARRFAGVPTWFLMYKHEKQVDDTLRIYAELSLASARDDQGKISSWYERIILPFLPFEGSLLAMDEGNDDGDEGDEIDVAVERR